MRVVAFVNGDVGHGVVRHLVDEGPGTLVGLVLHPPSNRTSEGAIINASGLKPASILEAGDLKSGDGRNQIADLQPDLGLSAYFGHILEPCTLALFPQGCINLHPSFLPYNRGAYPNVWSIVEDTPAGVTLHYMVEDVDAGPIIGRRRVPVSPTDTGATLYRKLQGACLSLFEEKWPEIARGRVEANEQSLEQVSKHRRADVEAIDEIHLDKSYKARELIDRLRARTFPPYEGCYFTVDGKRVYLRLGLWWEEDYPPEEADEDEQARGQPGGGAS